MNKHGYPLPSFLSSCFPGRADLYSFDGSMFKAIAFFGTRGKNILKLLQPFHFPELQKPALLILISTQSYYLFYEVNQLTNLQKRNPVAADCPVGLLLTHVMPLSESEKGAPPVGQMQPWIKRSSALQADTLTASHGCLLTMGADPLCWAFTDPSRTCEANEVPAGTWKSQDCSRGILGPPLSG